MEFAGPQELALLRAWVCNGKSAAEVTNSDATYFHSVMWGACMGKYEAWQLKHYLMEKDPLPKLVFKEFESVFMHRG
jgi:hypothetical protein